MTGRTVEPLTPLLAMVCGVQMACMKLGGRKAIWPVCSRCKLPTPLDYTRLITEGEEPSYAVCTDCMV